MRVVVADNDDIPSAVSLIRETAYSLDIDCNYVHAPARNISIARNAALEAATAPWVAFIDDDEIATLGWLAALLRHCEACGSTIVFGPVQAIYEGGAKWLRQADLHSVRPVQRADGAIDTGYTCNVLMNRRAMTDAMRAVRFDPSLGRSGGEDTFFFNRLYALGAKLSFAEAAIVHEPVTPGRARFGWLLKRSFRSGQSHARMLLATDGRRARHMVTASGKCVYCVISGLFMMTSASAWRKRAVRGALHAGVIARLSGLADLELY